jgi:4-hydroxybutyryl-CoA dehydratase / vinylacetyl-CoA-Delta-isomerase
MRTKDDYIHSLSDGREVYYRGRKVDSIVDHPVLKIAALHAAKLYDVAGRHHSNEDRMDEPEISAYFVTPRNSKDLMRRHELIYSTTKFCNGVFNISQAIGSDALFALSIVAKETDRKYNTKYSSAVDDYRRSIALKDLTLAVAQTDAKGDRKKRPHEQNDPDMYVHVSKTQKDGIIVRGAKAHTTQAAVADEIIVIPTRAMTANDVDYSIAFAVPANTKGLKMIVRPIDELEGNSSNVLSRLDYELETLTIFDDVFVPWDRVFLFKQYEMAGELAVNFATFHRFTAVSYRSATANLFLGTAASMAKQNGILESAHVKDKLVDLIMYKELMRMSAIAAANAPLLREEIAVPNPIYTNIGKLYSNRSFSQILDALIDLSGGIISTLPSIEDQNAASEGGYITKYLGAATSGRERIKMLRLAKELGASSLTGYLLTLMIHAEGSIEASKLALLKDADIAEAESLVNSIISQTTTS